MKKIFNFLLSAALAVTFSSCFEIAEEITIEKNGSGNYINKIDASKFMEQMQMMAALDTTGEMMPKLKYSLDSTFSTSWDAYKKVKGISNVKIDTSKEFIYILTMDFENVTALNNALGTGKGSNEQNMYVWEKGKISRKDVPLNLGDMKTEDEQLEMYKSFMTDFKYSIVFKVPSKVKKVSNEGAKTSEDKKTVTLETNMADVLDGKAKLGCEVTY